MSTPFGDGATPTQPSPTRRRRLLLAVLLAILVIIAILLLLSRCSTDDKSSPPSVNPSAINSHTTASVTASDTNAATPPLIAPSSTTPSASTPVPTSATPASSNLTANGTALLPLSTAAGPGGDLSRYAGQTVTAAVVLVQSVPALNGFWVGTSPTDEIWVQLLQREQVSPHAVHVGDHVSFTGTMVNNAAGFAQSVGVAADQGAPQLTAEKAHIETDKSSLSFTD